LERLRLGEVVDAWWRPWGLREREIIVQWVSNFYCQDSDTNYREAECFYRYSTDHSDSGQVSGLDRSSRV
jgi:hypothetical protein